MAHTEIAPRRRGRLVVGGSLLTLALVAGVFVAATAQAEAPSDPRATYVDGNATTCSDIGFPNDTILGSGGNPQASGTVTADANVSVTISAHVPEGQELNVVNITGVTIHGIVVKGGSAYNVYPGTVLTGLIAPFVGQNNNVPEISHWFLCYGPGTPPGGGGGGGAAAPVPGAPRFTG